MAERSPLAQASILVVDGDAAARESVAATLARPGLSIGTAASGQQALDLAAHTPFDLILSELHLPDMSGTDLVGHLTRTGAEPCFMFLSSRLTIHTAVEAMRIGALTVLEKPVAPEILQAAVSDALAQPACTTPPSAMPAARPGAPPMLEKPPRPVADRWASYVWKACGSLTDLKTLAEWARFLGVSYSSLSETSRLLLIRPHDARDFARVLRAVVQGALQDCRPEVLLDVSDRRTLRNLLRRTGSRGTTAPLSVEEFLEHQLFIPHDNEGIIELRALIDRVHGGATATRGR